MAVPIWPSPAPVSDEKESVRQLGYWESLFKRLTEYSVVLTALDNTAFAHRLISESLPFPIKPPVTKPANRISVDEWELSSLISSGLSSLSRKMEHLKAKKLNADIQMRSAEVPPKSSVEIKEEAYIKKRYRELSSIIAGLSAFTQSMGIKLYITTPYGPYFRFTSEELSKFSLTMMTESKEVWGSADEAVIKETELIERALASAADKYGSRLVSMAEFTRKNGMESGEFSTDGIHLTPKGYRHIAETLTLRLKNDGFCSAQRLRKGK